MRSLFLTAFFFTSLLFADKLEIEAHPPFPMKGETLSVVVKSDKPLEMIENFPEIKGWRSGSGIRQGSQSINGDSTYYFIGQYLPQKEGEFTIPSFKIRVNGKIKNTPEKKIKVIPNKTTNDKDKVIITTMILNLHIKKK